MRAEIIEAVQTHLSDAFTEFNLKKPKLNSSSLAPLSATPGLFKPKLGIDLTLPCTELPLLENRTTDFVHDYQNVLGEHGVSKVDVNYIALAYDKIRDAR